MSAFQLFGALFGTGAALSPRRACSPQGPFPARICDRDARPEPTAAGGRSAAPVGKRLGPASDHPLLPELGDLAL